jgi:hypothetical protein
MKIELVSKQFHKFAGRLHKKGEHLFATPAEARILKALGRAVPVEDAAPAAVEAKAKRAYKKRAVPAEASTVVPAMASFDIAIHPQPAMPVPKSLIDQVAKVKEDFRARFTGAPSPAMLEDSVPRETLTRPKAPKE